MRQTTNYQLPSWDSDDRILRTDFNDLTEKTDTALADHAAELTKLDGKLTAKGNCQIVFTTYTGTGTYGEENPCTLTFPHRPLVVFIAETFDTTTMIAIYGAPTVYARAIGTSWNQTTWGAKSFSWYSDGSASQLNETGKLYHVIAIMAADN